MTDAADLEALLAAAGRTLPDGWTGGEATLADGTLTRRFATPDGERVVFYAVREGGPATLARATWDDDRGEYVVGPELSERFLDDGRATDERLFRAALTLMAEA